jgi:tellurite resistance protein TehA-like permease
MEEILTISKNLFKNFYIEMTTKIILSDTAEIIIAQLFALILIIVIFRLIIYINRTFDQDPIPTKRIRRFDD